MRHKKVEVKTSNNQFLFSISKKHDEKILFFKNKNVHIKEYNSKIKELQKNISFTKSTKIEEYKSLINRLESGKEELDYLLNTMNILREYSEIVIMEENGEEVSCLLKQRKVSLIAEYLTVTKDESVNKLNYNALNRSIICKYCNKDMIEEEERYYACNSCDYTVEDIYIAKDLSYKERQDVYIKVPYRYEKETYLEEYLKRFEAMENKTIPQYVIDEVLLQIQKEGITVLNTLTESKMKKILKKINRQTYYENIISIINRINGREKFKLPQDVKEKLRAMFFKIQAPYNKHKPKNRKSFFSYPYILYQLFKILKLDEYCNYFQLLKSEEKLRVQDEIFKKVVEDLAKEDPTVDWVFYPTI